MLLIWVCGQKMSSWNQERVETYGKRKGCLDECEGDFVEEDALRLRLADRMDWDSARSRERNERNSCSSRRGWRVP